MEGALGEIVAQVVARGGVLRSGHGEGGRGMRDVVRADSAYYAGAVVSAARRAGAFFSITAQNNTSIQAAIAGIADQAWQAVRYPGCGGGPRYR
jgi:hypothetical protein